MHVHITGGLAKRRELSSQHSGTHPFHRCRALGFGQAVLIASGVFGTRLALEIAPATGFASTKLRATNFTHQTYTSKYGEYAPKSFFSGKQ